MKKILINAPFVKAILAENKLVVVDGGARGELFASFREVDKSVFTMLRFEPDSNSEIISTENEIVFNKALWNKNGKISINIAQEPTTSSVFEIDERILKQIDPQGIEQRRTVKKVEVDAVSIDEVCRQHGLAFPDFIKLDIHGSEYEALEGAADALAQTTFGALVETWTLPIHKGQKTHAEVEALLNRYGIYLFDCFPLIQWARQAPGAHFNRTQIGGWDGLYFKDVIGTDFSRSYTLPQALKCMVLADLYGHHAYTLQLADYFHEIGTVDQQLYNNIRNFMLPRNKMEELRIKWLQKMWVKTVSMLTRLA